MSRFINTFAALLCLCGAAVAQLDFPQLGGQDNGFNFGPQGGGLSITADYAPVDADMVDLKVTLNVPTGNYFYSTSTKSEASRSKFPIDPPFEVVGDIKADRKAKLKGGEQVYFDTATFTIRVRKTTGPLQAGDTVSGGFTGQYCNNSTCIPVLTPKPFEVQLSDDIGDGQAVTVPSPATDKKVPDSEGVVTKTLTPLSTIDEPIHAKVLVSLSPASPSAGDYVTFKITVQVPDGWYTYDLNKGALADPITVFDLKTEGLEPVGDEFKVDSTPEEKEWPLGGVVYIHHGEVSWTREYSVADPNAQISGTIKLQTCSDGTCEPGSVDFQLATLASDTVPSTGDRTETAKLADGTNKTGTEEDQALGLFIMTGIGAGLLALLTPCVFPMIPVTVSYFLKQGEQNPGATTKLAFVFCLTIVGAFTGLGMLITVIFGHEALNAFANNGWVNIFFAIVFVGFALMLLGMFDITIPSWLVTWSSRKQDAGGLVGAIFMAITFTLISFTCTFGFIGPLLIVATQGSYLRPVLGMLAFSSAFSFPFLMLALFPKLLKKMPKSGGWMNTVKVTLGLLEFAIVTKFLSVADVYFSSNGLPVFFDFHMVMSSWIAVAGVIGLYLLGFFRTPHDIPDQPVGPIRGLIAVTFMGFAVYLGTGVFGDTAPKGAIWQNVAAFAPQDINVQGKTVTHHGLAYGLDFDKGLELSSKENKLLFVDFTGQNCPNCRLMEDSVFPQHEIHEKLKDMVRVQLYVDKVPGADPEEGARIVKRNQELQKHFRTAALPAYAIISPDGKKSFGLFTGSDPTGGRKFHEFLTQAEAQWADHQVSASGDPARIAATK